MPVSPYEQRQVSRETAAGAVFGTLVSRETMPTTVDGVDGVPRETVTAQPIAAEAAQAVRALNLDRVAWPAPGHTRVMAVANQKGGVGKTTSTVNLAAALALHGLRVLVVDLDPQGNASTALGIAHAAGTASSYDLLLEGSAVDDVRQSVTVAPGFACVPATIDLAGAEIELTPMNRREYRLKDALSDEAGRWDYIFIDCPPSLGLLTLNALVAAHEVLIPIQCEYYALEGLAQLLGTIDLVAAHLNPHVRVSTVVLTMYDGRTRLADQVAEEVRKHFGPLVLDEAIPRNVRVSEAPGFGQTVLTYDGGSRGAAAYLAAAEQLARTEPQPVAKQDSRAAASSFAPRANTMSAAQTEESHDE